jgi:hypothetical protein
MAFVLVLACSNETSGEPIPSNNGDKSSNRIPEAGADSPGLAETSTDSSSTQAIGKSSQGSSLLKFSVGRGSEATFTVNEKLSKLTLPNDAVLRTGEITGDIDLADGTASLVIDLHTLKSDESRRDRYVKDRLFPTQPEATISVTEIPSLPVGLELGEKFLTTLTAVVNVNGTDADIEFNVESRLDPDRLLVLVKGDFTWADFGMNAPASRFFVVKDDVHVEVLVSADPK